LLELEDVTDVLAVSLEGNSMDLNLREFVDGTGGLTSLQA
jgi:hypothetical protein